MFENSIIIGIEMHPLVKIYLEKQTPDRSKIMEKLREILIEAVPGLNEKMEYGVMCYDDLYYIANLPKHINMGFSIIGLNPEEVKLFQGTGKTMRHLKFVDIDSIDKEELLKIIKLVREKASPVHPKNKK
ncbi:MAG TPA: DUF1801 domain-containing protein [Methanofastidiosum sp.]|nr:DUF1801 domain-containing protein [Methanofastidiosum sp.]HQK63382.1 DUF1801 domain-containing protein [Methanofastidiosum sp.]